MSGIIGKKTAEAIAIHIRPAADEQGNSLPADDD